MPQDSATTSRFVSSGRVVPWILLMGGLLLIVAAGLFAAYRQSAERQGFVSRDGMALHLEGQPYRFNGYDVPGFFGCGDDLGWTIDEHLREQYFASLPPGSMTRVGYYNAKQADQLAEIVSTARRYSQKLLISFADHQGECDQPAKGDAWYAGEYKRDYLRRVQQAAAAYKDEPTVAIWEPISRPAGSTRTLERFLGEMTSVIKDTAPKQLISSGTLLPTSDAEGAQFTALNSARDIDVAGGYDTAVESTALSPDFARAKAALDGLDKPLVAQWRLAAGPQPSACASYGARASQAADVMNAYFDQQIVAGLLYNYLAASDTQPCAGAANLANSDDSLFYAANAYQIPGIPPVVARPIVDNTPSAPESAEGKAPTGLRPALIASDTVSFAWNPPAMAAGRTLAGYNIFRNGVVVATSVLPGFTDASLSPDTNYTYKVSAYDEQGNLSAESSVLTLTTTKPTSGNSASKRPFGLTAVDVGNLLRIPAGDHPRVSRTITVSNPDQQDKAIAKAELLVNKRVRASATKPPFALQLDTRVLTNAEHEVSYRLELKDGSFVSSTRTIVTKNNLNLFERIRNAALEPLAGSSSGFLNGIFIALAGAILVVPVLIVAAFSKLRGIENSAEDYRKRQSFWGDE